jgi:hypothetical protein
MRVGEVTGVDLCAPVEQQRGDDQEDPQQDKPRGAGVAPGEARCPACPMRIATQPDDAEGDDAGQHPDREQVLAEADHGPVADDRDRERLAEQVPVSLDDRQQQHDRAPEGQRVRDPRHRPFQQLSLPDHLSRLMARAPARAGADSAIRAAAGCPA